MLKNSSEKDFHELKWVALDRLSPNAISAFFVATFFGSGIFTLVVAVGAIHNSYINNDFWGAYVKICIAMLILQLLIALVFLSEKIAFKFQRFQSILLSMISLKFSIDMYSFYFLICDDRNAPNYMYTTGLWALLGGFIYLIISSIRGIRRVQQGEFRKGGKSLYNFQKSKGYVSLPIIFGATTIGGNMASSLSDMSSVTSKMIEMYVALLFAMAIQYTIALVWPEFLLLTYCKFRFTSFRISAPERVRKQRRSFKDSLLYWYNKPLIVLKSRTGWRYEEKAPFWTLILVWLQLSFGFVLLFYLIDLYGVWKGKIALGELKDDLTTFTSANIAMFLSFALLIIVKLILIVVKKIKK